MSRRPSGPRGPRRRAASWCRDVHGRHGRAPALSLLRGTITQGDDIPVGQDDATCGGSLESNVTSTTCQSARCEHSPPIAWMNPRPVVKATIMRWSYWVGVALGVAFAALALLLLGVL